MPATTTRSPGRFRVLLVGAAVATMAGLVAPSPALAIPTDPPTCFGHTVTRFAVAGQATEGTSGSDVILGTSGDDQISGLAGNDYICGMGGNDKIYGDGWATNGNDYVDGGLGDNMISGGSGNDHLYANYAGAVGYNRSRLFGDSGNDYLYGGEGNDYLSDGNGTDHLAGRAGGDHLVSSGNSGTLGPDVFSGGADGDQVESIDSPLDGVDDVTSGPKEVHGGDGNDLLGGSSTPDRIFGEGGEDSIYCLGGVDAADGGSGQDTLVDPDSIFLPDPSPYPGCETVTSIP